ncbi:unnamed protein product [Heterobilharzia americana]|nr:unnamed protein product [Heterobilharzia americana]
MKLNGPVLPRFYGRPKLHKPNNPLPTTVSTPGTPTYMSTELSRKLKHVVQSRRLHQITNRIPKKDQEHSHRKRRINGILRCHGTIHIHQTSIGQGNNVPSTQ